MCFTTKRDNIPDLKLNGETIETVDEFKYLGMTLDAPYLTWEPHIGKIVTNSLKTINLMRVLAGTKWGADRQSLLKINEALIRSRIAYGCPAFISAAESNLKKLEVIQNAALRLALGVWKSTRIPNLQVEANVVPVKLFIKQQSINLYFKLKAMGPNNSVHQQIFNNEDIRHRVFNNRLAKKPFVLIVESIIPSWNLTTYPVIPPWYNLN